VTVRPGIPVEPVLTEAWQACYPSRSVTLINN
jgi:hypothetical protein